MRLRIPELLERRGLSAYALSRQSAGRISMSTAYRLVEKRGRLETYSGELLEALCDVLDITFDELCEREAGKPRKRAA